jgi:integrase/recombinase XerD
MQVLPYEQSHAQQHADTDPQLIALWLHGRPASTQADYGREIQRFLAFVGKSLRSVTLGDVQAFADSLSEKAPSSRARILSSLKSLFAFGYRLGYLPFDVGRPLRLPARKSTLAERIMTEADTHRVIALEPNRRNRVMLRLLYASGVRVSELCGLKWRDCKERNEVGQITVLGKGDKTRSILLSAATWKVLMDLRGTAGEDDPVFPSRTKRGHLTRAMVSRIVKAAAVRAGASPRASSHWLRHSHATHAIERGAPLALVQKTLGHDALDTTGKYLHARPKDSSSRYIPV